MNELYWLFHTRIIIRRLKVLLIFLLDALKFIFKMASKGMMKLQNSYQIGTARLTLQHYINLINTCLEKEELVSSLSNETDDKNNIIYIKFSKNVS